MMKKVIVTGATGFIGSNLVYKLIENGFEVGILCRDLSRVDMLSSLENKIKIYRTNDDLNKIIDVFKEFQPDCVFHIASLFIAEHSKGDVDKLIKSNILYPNIILEAMKECGITNIINTGTAWQHYSNEEYNPVCLYAATKEAFEKLAEYYVRALEFKCITLKIFDSYGPNDNRGKLMSILKNKALNKEKLHMTEGNQKIDLTHIDDITNGFIKAYEYLDTMDLGKHEKYALCTGRELTLKKALEIFQKETGYKLDIEWGAKNYRKREVMNLWTTYKKLPNWESNISFEEGVKTIV